MDRPGVFFRFMLILASYSENFTWHGQKRISFHLNLKLQKCNLLENSHWCILYACIAHQHESLYLYRCVILVSYICLRNMLSLVIKWHWGVSCSEGCQTTPLSSQMYTCIKQYNTLCNGYSFHDTWAKHFFQCTFENFKQYNRYR